MLTHGDYNYKVNIKGFHGTSLKAAKKIIEEKEFKLGDFREDHWLGQGAYFFRDDYEQANTWAYFKIKENENGAVIEANVEVDNKNFLNLDSRKGYLFFNSFYNQFKQHCLEQEIELGEKTKTELRCFVCDQLPDDIKIIQRTFSNREKELAEVEVGLNGVQLCIRDSDILDFEKIKIVGLIPFRSKKRKGHRRPKKLLIEESDIHEI
ncbi:hypothetical protein ACTOS9_03530 [Bacillus subtilis]|uniref:DUF3990 domain-containing protein n=1 Tax=Bacillus subtilis TaxID=1423 RepID=A0AAX3RK17_BACIU|nr:hypothetical protein P5633_21585 [Bacillus subtilis]WGD63147.1 hypothetical protein P5648_03585 [Bacillus subtilis]